MNTFWFLGYKALGKGFRTHPCQGFVELAKKGVRGAHGKPSLWFRGLGFRRRTAQFRVSGFRV